MPCDKSPSRRLGEGFYCTVTTLQGFKTSHYSFIPIHKCHFVKKSIQKNTITDTLTVEKLRFEIFLQKLCEEYVARGLCVCLEIGYKHTHLEID